MDAVVVEKWPLWRGGRCGEVAVVERWPLRRSGRCGEVAAGGSTLVSTGGPVSL